MIKDDYSCPQSARIGLGRIEAGAEADWGRIQVRAKVQVGPERS